MLAMERNMQKATEERQAKSKVATEHKLREHDMLEAEQAIVQAAMTQLKEEAAVGAQKQELTNYLRRRRRVIEVGTHHHQSPFAATRAAAKLMQLRGGGFGSVAQRLLREKSGDVSVKTQGRLAELLEYHAEQALLNGAELSPPPREPGGSKLILPRSQNSCSSFKRKLQLNRRQYRLQKPDDTSGASVMCTPSAGARILRKDFSVEIPPYAIHENMLLTAEQVPLPGVRPLPHSKLDLASCPLEVTLGVEQKSMRLEDSKKATLKLRLDNAITLIDQVAVWCIASGPQGPPPDEEWVRLEQHACELSNNGMLAVSVEHFCIFVVTDAPEWSPITLDMSGGSSSEMGTPLGSPLGYALGLPLGSPLGSLAPGSPLHSLASPLTEEEAEAMISKSPTHIRTRGAAHLMKVFGHDDGMETDVESLGESEEDESRRNLTQSAGPARSSSNTLVKAALRGKRPRRLIWTTPRKPMKKSVDFSETSPNRLFYGGSSDGGVTADEGGSGAVSESEAWQTCASGTSSTAEASGSESGFGSSVSIELEHKEDGGVTDAETEDENITLHPTLSATKRRLVRPVRRRGNESRREKVEAAMRRQELAEARHKVEEMDEDSTMRQLTDARRRVAELEQEMLDRVNKKVEQQMARTSLDNVRQGMGRASRTSSTSRTSSGTSESSAIDLGGEGTRGDGVVNGDEAANGNGAQAESTGKTGDEDEDEDEDEELGGWKASSGLPEGWKAIDDGSGREYFYNLVTGESVWERPTSGVPDFREVMEERAAAKRREQALVEAAETAATPLKKLGADAPPLVSVAGGDSEMKDAAAAAAAARVVAEEAAAAANQFYARACASANVTVVGGGLFRNKLAKRMSNAEAAVGEHMLKEAMMNAGTRRRSVNEGAKNPLYDGPAFEDPWKKRKDRILSLRDQERNKLFDKKKFSFGEREEAQRNPDGKIMAPPPPPALMRPNRRPSMSPMTMRVMETPKLKGVALPQDQAKLAYQNAVGQKLKEEKQTQKEMEDEAAVMLQKWARRIAAGADAAAPFYFLRRRSSFVESAPAPPALPSLLAGWGSPTEQLSQQEWAESVGMSIAKVEDPAAFLQQPPPEVDGSLVPKWKRAELAMPITGDGKEAPRYDTNTLCLTDSSTKLKRQTNKQTNKQHSPQET
jgi:hypothetical protein